MVLYPVLLSNRGIVEIRYGRGKYSVFLTPKYVNGSDKPDHFGNKAWKEYSKEALMELLGIENFPVDYEYMPPLDFQDDVYNFHR